MKFDLSPDRTFTMKASDPEFVGTELAAADSQVSFTLKAVPREVHDRVTKANTTLDKFGKPEVNYSGIARSLFVHHCVVSWSGIDDLAGNPIPCTPEMRGIFADNFGTIANIVAGAAVNNNVELRRLNDAEKGESKPSSAGV